MTAVIVGLGSLALALLIVRIMLNHWARRLKVREQAFRFHAIRDDLQLLALEGVIKQSDPAYDFLLWTTNLGIQNAGVMRLRDLVSIAARIDSRIESDIPKRLERSPKEVQRVAAELFEALVMMLIRNDWIVLAGWHCMRAVSSTWRWLRPTVRLLDRLAARIVPARARAVEYAREYSQVADRLQAA